MARSSTLRRMATLAILCSTVVGQPGQRRDDGANTTSKQPSNSFDARPTSTSSSSSSTSSTARSEFTTAVVPVYLVDIAESLLHEYFPSTTPLDLAEVSWPSTVVIGTATYGLNEKAKETTAHTTPTTSQQKQQQTQTNSPSKENNSDQKHDEDLAIILACVLGFVAIAIAAVIFCCLRRRRDTNGSFFLRRSSPSTSSKGSRFNNVFGGNTAYQGNDLETREASGTAPLTAAAAVAGADRASGLFPRPHSNSDSDENQYYTPRERHDSTLSYSGLAAQQHHRPETNQWEPVAAAGQALRSSNPTRPTILRKPIASRQNPFSSPLDREADDTVSPILPSRSPERHGGPMVHYPSMSEVSEFDFAGDGRRSSAAANNRWRASGERLDGRHELM